MTDYTSIPNSAIESGKPIRAIDGLALRDNPIAIAEGAPGAPRISPWAVRTVVAAGDTVRYADMLRLGLTRQMGTSFIMYKSVLILSSGTIRVKYRTVRPVVVTGNGTLTTQVIRMRGTTTTSLSESTHAHSSGSALNDRTVSSIDVLPGDSICIQGRFSSGDDLSAGAAFEHFTVSTDGGYLWALGGGSMVLAAEPV